ncbi:MULTISPECIES: hypothetical protein [Aeromonas]|uniref:DUF3019 domain-containing protein n=1 Tax=Aeromonas caviae TaxID=648 RepID=A0AA42VDJ6_AERCA|nr:hypothetical protein [Aeromonas caviae]MDH1899218.1 hypothetical protein [Aeromonas caviae]
MKKSILPLFMMLMSGSPLLWASAPFTGVLPAKVIEKTGTSFWCNEDYRQQGKCIATEISNLSMIIVRSQPLDSCEAGMWGWITSPNYLQKKSFGLTITPDEKFNISMKDMCRPGTIVKFQPNKKYKGDDDLVGFHNGKEIFRYGRE